MCRCPLLVVFSGWLQLDLEKPRQVVRVSKLRACFLHAFVLGDLVKSENCCFEFLKLRQVNLGCFMNHKTCMV